MSRDELINQLEKYIEIIGFIQAEKNKESLLNKSGIPKDIIENMNYEDLDFYERLRMGSYACYVLPKIGEKLAEEHGACFTGGGQALGWFLEDYL